MSVSQFTTVIYYVTIYMYSIKGEKEYVKNLHYSNSTRSSPLYA